MPPQLTDIKHQLDRIERKVNRIMANQADLDAALGAWEAENDAAIAEVQAAVDAIIAKVPPSVDTSAEIARLQAGMAKQQQAADKVQAIANPMPPPPPPPASQRK